MTTQVFILLASSLIRLRFPEEKNVIINLLQLPGINLQGPSIEEDLELSNK